MKIVCAVRAAVILLAFSVVLSAVSPVAAAGQTVVRAGYPNPWTLLSKALKEQGREGSAHGVGRSTITTKTQSKTGLVSVTDSGVFVGDALTSSNGRSRVQEQAIETVGSKQTEFSYEYVTVGKKLALAPSSTHKWHCQPFSLLNQIPEWTPVSFGVLSLKPKPASASVVGTAVVDGTHTWQVKIVLTSPKSKGTQSTDFLIDQKTFAVRDMATVASWIQKGQKWRESMSVTLSKFGEPVSAKMPLKC